MSAAEPALPPASSLEDYLDGWRTLHGGYDPRSNRLVLGWLRITHAVARPLAGARVSPDMLTAGALAVSASVVAVAAIGGRWLLAAGLLVVLAGLLDNLDGAVAVMSGRVSRYGMVLDSSCDRVSDLLFVTSLWVAGAPGLLCAVGGGLMFLQEYVRAQAAVAGMRDIGGLTFWERPTRVIVTAMFLGAAGAWRESSWALLGAAAWVGLGALGVVQISLVVRRRLG